MKLTRHDEGVFSSGAPLVFMGLPIGSRMTIVRLRDGSLLVHSPVPLDAELRAAVDAEGAVSHIVAPSMYHHLYAGHWAAAYPKATVYGPRALRKKRRDLRIDRDLEDVRAETFGDELVPLHVDGSMLDETVFVHPASRTLVSADLTENFGEVDGLGMKIYLKVGGIYGKPGLSRLLRVVYRDKKAARRSVDALLEHDFDRVVLAHGDVLERDGKRVVRETFGFLGKA